jgi:hypothetical protein
MLVQNNKPEIKDQKFDSNETDSKFNNHLFIRVVGKKIKFSNVDFKYSTFDAAYFRDCIFDSCNFIGCRFINSNFHGSKFSGCKFDYAFFDKTQIDSHILSTECPAHENLKLKFARSLRMNFAQLGDAEAVNHAILIELDATKTHLLKAWKSNESYYRKKYTGITRLAHFIKWLLFILLDLLWGNGEKPYKLAWSVFFFLCIVALVQFVSCEIHTGEKLLNSVAQAPQLFLGTIKAEGLWYTFIQLVRYVVFALMMSVLIRRLSRR